MFGSLKDLISSLVEDARLKKESRTRIPASQPRRCLSVWRPSTAKCRRLDGKSFTPF